MAGAINCVTPSLTLTITPNSTNTTTISACGTYTWANTAITYTASGVYTYSTTNAVGCDSTTTLNLTIKRSTTSTTNVTNCDSYTWNGVTYTTKTYLKGVMEKYVPGDYEFDVPQKLMDLYKAKDYGQYADSNGKLPVCFIGTGPQLTFDKNYLFMSAELNEIKQDRVVIKNEGSTTVTYEWKKV